MTAQEYVLATDVRALGCALAALRELTPLNNPHIDDEEFVFVLAQLYKWQGATRAALEVLS